MARSTRWSTMPRRRRSRRKPMRSSRSSRFIARGASSASRAAACSRADGATRTLDLRRRHQPHFAMRAYPAYRTNLRLDTLRGALCSLCDSHDVAIGRQRFIVGQKNQWLAHRLCDKHPIERIAMMKRQPREHPGVFPGDRQLLEAPVTKCAQKLIDVDLKLTQCCFDADFPNGHGAHMNQISMLNCSFCAPRESFGAHRGPNNNVGIQQYLQDDSSPSNNLRISSGRGASKSGASFILPFMNPILDLRRLRGSRGHSRATGLPDLAMTKVAPLLTSSSKAESRVLAS